MFSHKWNFEKPDCFVSEESEKHWNRSIQLAIFHYYNQKNICYYFTNYIEKLKSDGFVESELSFPIKKTNISDLTILDYTILENDSVIVYCELLACKKYNNAAILVAMSDKSEIDVLKRIVTGRYSCHIVPVW